MEMAFPSSTPAPTPPPPGAFPCFSLLEEGSSEPEPEGGEAWLRFDKQAGDFRSNQGRKNIHYPRNSQCSANELGEL